MLLFKSKKSWTIEQMLPEKMIQRNVVSRMKNLLDR